MWIINHTKEISPPEQSDVYFSKAYDFVTKWKSAAEEFILNTSGSTGVPKLITLTRSQMIASARLTGAALELGQGTRALVCLHTDYIAGTMMLVRGLELGWDLTVIKPVANPLLEIPADMQFDFTALVPMQLAQCLANEQTSARATAFGKILLGGAPVSVSLQEAVTDKALTVYQSYGMTETVSHIAIRQLSPQFQESYTVLGDNSIGVDARGCLHIKGAVTRYELIQTNDIVELVPPDSFLWIGRADHVINSGGVKIVLDQVDMNLAALFNAGDIGVVFFTWHQADELLGQKLVLFIESEEDNLLRERVVQEIRKLPKAYEIPKHVYFVPQFEKTATGKIDKRLTAELNLNRSHE